jgi:hypothetical protein
MDIANYFTKETYKEFKKLYDKAVKDKVTVFKFQSQDVDINYAKYIIQYLDNIFKK